jgi:hypothetical protein
MQWRELEAWQDKHQLVQDSAALHATWLQGHVVQEGQGCHVVERLQGQVYFAGAVDRARVLDVHGACAMGQHVGRRQTHYSGAVAISRLGSHHYRMRERTCTLQLAPFCALLLISPIARHVVL